MSRLIKQKVSNRIVLGKSIINQAGLGAEVEIIIQIALSSFYPQLNPKGGKYGQLWAKTLLKVF